MILLTLIFCLHTRCVTTRTPIQTGLMGCVVGAQQQAQEWIGAHPGWRLVTFRCGDAGEGI